MILDTARIEEKDNKLYLFVEGEMVDEVAEYFDNLEQYHIRFQINRSTAEKLLHSSLEALSTNEG